MAGRVVYNYLLVDIDILFDSFPKQILPQDLFGFIQKNKKIKQLWLITEDWLPVWNSSLGLTLMAHQRAN